MIREQACELCGATARDVSVKLVAWKDSDRPFEALPRCGDHEACRERCLAQGDAWPVRDERAAVRL